MKWILILLLFSFNANAQFDIQLGKEDQKKDFLDQNTVNPDQHLKSRKYKWIQKNEKFVITEFVKNPIVDSSLKNNFLQIKYYFNKSNILDSIRYKILESGLNFEFRSNTAQLSSKSTQLIEQNLQKTAQKLKIDLNTDCVLTNYIVINELTKSIPKDIIFTNSKVLNLENHNLNSLPKEIYKQKNTEVLILSKNHFTKLKLKTKKLPKLKSLILNDNFLTEKTLKVNRNKTIKIINLNNNIFENLPKNKSKNIEEILFANNNIIELKNLESYKNIRNFNLYNNEIHTLNRKIKKLQLLETLDLYHNNIKNIPNEIGNLTKLNTLAIAYNKLKLEKLEKLYVSYNNLTEIKQLPLNLKYLDISSNLLPNIPASFNNLDNLEHLDITNNPMSGDLNHLPKNIQKLNFGNNKFNAKDLQTLETWKSKQ